MEKTIINKLTDENSYNTFEKIEVYGRTIKNIDNAYINLNSGMYIFELNLENVINGTVIVNKNNYSKIMNLEMLEAWRQKLTIMNYTYNEKFLKPRIIRLHINRRKLTCTDNLHQNQMHLYFNENEKILIYLNTYNDFYIIKYLDVKLQKEKYLLTRYANTLIEYDEKDVTKSKVLIPKSDYLGHSYYFEDETNEYSYIKEEGMNKGLINYIDNIMKNKKNWEVSPEYFNNEKGKTPLKKVFERK